MPGPLPLALRLRVLEAYVNKKGTIQSIADRFKVSQATVKSWARRYREEGHVESRPYWSHNPAKMPQEHWPWLKKLVDEKPTILLGEIVEAFYEETGVRISDSAVCQTLKRAGLTRENSVIRRRKPNPSVFKSSASLSSESNRPSIPQS